MSSVKMSGQGQQNLCLICCFTFQEKPNRFISVEARESFDTFSKQLGFPLLTNHGGGGRFILPFGDSVTVCGDCLSLVVAYVQRRAVQEEKEERLKELQMAVCKALKVVEDVKCHLDQLHSTVRMGDGDNLGKFINKKRRSLGNKEKEKAKLFREKVLSLKSGAEKFERRDVRHPRRKDESIPIRIKSEPGIGPESSCHGGHLLEDRVPVPPSHVEPWNDAADFDGEEGDGYLIDTNDDNDSISFDNDGGNDDLHCKDSGEEDNGGDDSSHYKESTTQEKKTTKSIKSKPKGKKRGRPRKHEQRPVGLGLKRGPTHVDITSQEAQQWNDDLFARIREEFNSQQQNEQFTIKNEGIPPSTLASESEPPPPPPNLNCFQVIHDQNLQFRNVIIKVNPAKRMLECSKCLKMYFQYRDIDSSKQDNVRLESLIKFHIIDKHPGPSSSTSRFKAPPSQEDQVDVIQFHSSKLSSQDFTFKIADPNGYSYHRRKVQIVNGVTSTYYSCDFRKGHCNASILLKNDKFTKMRRGWTSDGYHQAHSPNPQQTNRQITLGRAKEMYLKEPDKSADEICSIVLSQCGPLGVKEELSFKRSLQRIIPKEDERRHKKGRSPGPEQMCSLCGKIFKGKASMSRHLKMTHHQVIESESSAEAQGPSGYQVDHFVNNY